MKNNTWLLALVISAPLYALAQHTHGSPTPYAGIQTRAIKSLSENDTKELRRGGDRGLALAAESAIESAFAKGTVDEVSLRRLLADAESAKTELRLIHLSQHFKTVQYLQPEQVKRYNMLRGYTEDPCKNVPEGHKPDMYRRHMGCS